MPYKDPERKREWERQHREERNARRRTRRSSQVDVQPNRAQSYGTGATDISADSYPHGVAAFSLILVTVIVAVVGVFTRLRLSTNRQALTKAS